MSFTTEKLSLASKAVFEAQRNSATVFAQAAYESGLTLLELNLEAFRTAFAAATVSAKQLLAIRDLREWASVSATQSQQAFERAGDYGRQAGELARETQEKFSEVAQTEFAASQQKVGELAEIVQAAPGVAAEPVNTFMKSAFDTAQAGYDRFTQAAGTAAAGVADTVAATAESAAASAEAARRDPE